MVTKLVQQSTLSLNKFLPASPNKRNFILRLKKMYATKNKTKET